MGLKINDKSIGITIPNANVRIDYHVVNPGTPFVKRKKSTFEKNEAGDEVEILGAIIETEKRYNVNLFLQFLNEGNEGVYHREVVSINDLREDELNFKEYYTRLKNVEKFSGAKDN